MRDPGSELNKLREENLYRELKYGASATGRTFHSGNLSLLNFSSNDYLGLGSHETIKEAVTETIASFGVGSGASRMLSGGTTPHLLIEKETANFFGKDSSLFFANGYGAALGTLGAILQKGDTVILDKLCHASLIDGSRLSSATVRTFPHNNVDKLKKILNSINENDQKKKRILIVTEGIFSMDGDSSPIKEIIKLKKQHQALLLLDEAHSFGIIGESGKGIAHRENIINGVDFLMTTFGKSAGAAGSVVVSSGTWIELILNRARSFIYSTAPMPSQAAAALAGLRLIRGSVGEERRISLHRNIEHLCNELQIPKPQGAIIPLIIGGELEALRVSGNLHSAGILAPAIRYPTVSKGSARIRITISANHSEKDIAFLAKTIKPSLIST
ncbi:MAG TPA: 8-amino-7-oxononanoate synthase [Verrucomicrobia bacterium]|nr:8-amino-7-oxononanoate synthase [Verrucomicrobiales bacterium]HIL54636.1 8-amino-7-oxononanoate synthase [Verrucomicrobiota bacterium]